MANQDFYTSNIMDEYDPLTSNRELWSNNLGNHVCSVSHHMVLQALWFPIVIVPPLKGL